MQNLEIRDKNANECKNLQIFRLDRCEGVKDLVDLEKCFPMSIYLQKIGVDTAENEPLEVWGQFNS